MGVYIPNMSKPKRCADCPMFKSTFGDEYIPSHDDCRSLKKRFNVKKLDIDPFKEILPNCPLIKIDDEIWELLKPKVETMSLAERGWITDDSNT